MDELLPKTSAFEVDVNPLWVTIFLLGCNLCYQFCNYLIFDCAALKSVLGSLGRNKKLKCRVYIYETVLTTICLVVLASTGVLELIFREDDQWWLSQSPEDLKRYKRVVSVVFNFLLCFYIMEMILTPEMRAPLKLHHCVTIAIVLWSWIAMADVKNVTQVLWLKGVFRCGLCIGLYPFTEQFVFIQMLVYRINPCHFPSFHLFGAVLYTLTRIGCCLAFMVCWMEWMYSVVKPLHSDEIIGNHKVVDNVGYVSYFYAVAVLNLVLNWTQWQSVKALFHVYRSVKSNAREMHETAEHSQSALYSIFMTMAESHCDCYFSSENVMSTEPDAARLTFEAFSTLISDTLHVTADQRTVSQLWAALGYKKEEKRHSNDGMQWPHFQLLFEASLVGYCKRKGKQLGEGSGQRQAVRVMRARIKQLLHGVEQMQSRLDVDECSERLAAAEIHKLKFEIDATLRKDVISAKGARKGGIVSRLLSTSSDRRETDPPKTEAKVSRCVELSIGEPCLNRGIADFLTTSFNTDEV